jgi:hypothetical protein
MLRKGMRVKDIEGEIVEKKARVKVKILKEARKIN